MNALFEALCRASAFALAALFIALSTQWLLGKRAPAAWRAWIWRIALLQSAFALLPLAPIRWEVLAPPTVALIAATPTARAKPEEFPGADNLNLPPLEIPDATPIESAAPIPVPIAQAPQTPFDWRALVLAIYVLGIAFQVAQLMRGQRQLRRILRACTPNENSILTARLSTLTARLGLKTAPQLLISEGNSPFLTGVWRPRIVLPRALCEAQQSQLDAVLAHELAHAKRHDLIWLSATWLLQTLLWLHPLSWFSRRFHGLETECACDELALQLAPIAPQSYGALLLNSMNNSKFSSPLAAGTCDTLFALKTRLLRLNNTPRKPHKMAKFAFVTALLLSCGALVPLKLVAREGDAPAETKQVAPTPKIVGSAVVRGVVVSKQTKLPLAGVKIMLFGVLPKKKASDQSMIDIKTKREVVTDARGYFRFNTISGEHILGVAVDITTAPKSIRVFAQIYSILNLKDGEKSDFKFDLDETIKNPDRTRIPTRAPKTRGTGNAVVQGVVTSKQTQEPLVGLPIILLTRKSVSKASSYQKTETDTRGYFRFNAAGGAHRLFVDGKISVAAGKATGFTAQEIYDFPLKDAEMRNLKIETGKAPTVPKSVVPPAANQNVGGASGRIADENKPTLIGIMAPEIQALHWANGKAAPLSSLRGKVVLLAFENFDPNEKSVLNDLARSLKGRVQIVGVQVTLGHFNPSASYARLDKIAAQFSFPIALDTPHSDSKKFEFGGQTFSAYGLGARGYAVIGRDGKILYKGGNLKSAVQIASR